MLTTSLLPERCRLVVEETLPKGMYVDPDQLRDVAEFTGLRTYVSGKMIDATISRMTFELDWSRAFCCSRSPG